jgi:NhaA family Na+:H+ antiporter
MAKNSHSKQQSGLPREPIDAFVDPLKRFLHVETASGIVLLIATAAALILANSPLAGSFLSFWKTKTGFTLGAFEMKHSLQHWINDFLMAIFFFVIGLEVKREIVMGELRDLKRAALPIAAAIGGMVVPAAIYLFLQAGEPGARGWGIPMATDIAFVVGCLAILGPRIPNSLRVLLLSLAIADDIGAILVIAIGYTESLDYTALFLGFGFIGLFLGLMKIGVRNTAVYAIVALFVWFWFHESGIHATIAGVIIGLLTPTESWISENRLSQIVQRTLNFMHGDGWRTSGERYAMLREMERAARKTISPLQRFETDLHPWVGFLIMPVFALANAGVPIELSSFGDPVAVAIMLGLLIGKPLGIVLFSWLAIRIGLAKLPDDISWGALLGGGCLAGIGFTMALFIAGLALQGALLDAAKIGILSGSFISAILGFILLIVTLPKPSQDIGS